MNENLYVSNHGLRLITQFEGAPRLKARLCEGGRYELSYGVTFHLDGRPVEAEETCTEDYAMAMFRNALGQFEEIVKRHVTIELTQYQFDALVAFSYNVGEANFASSTVLRETNARRFEDAAAAFGMWVFATRDGWKQAYRGLLRRRYAEATLYMGYDWVQATEDGENGAISLQRIPPPGDPPKGSDKVTYKTPFLEVLRVAQHYPLAPDTQEPVEAKPAPAPLQDSAKPLPQPAVPSAADTKGTEPVSQAPSPPPLAPSPIPNSSSSKLGSPGPVIGPTAPHGPPVAAPASTIQKPAPRLPDPPVPIGQQTSAVDAARKSEDWSRSAKAMWQSRRFWGLVLVLGGRGYMLWTGSSVVLGAVSDPIVTEMFSGFMVMIIGELVQHWGERKATRPLK